MRWFGESWGAPINEDTPHAPTPVTAPCERCKKPIEENDRGVLIPMLGAPDERLEVAYHLRCWLASVVGDQMADEVLDEVALRDQQDEPST